MEKVVIPREVAEEIEHLRSGVGYGTARDNAYICELAMRTGGGVPTATQILRRIPFDTLLSALVNGYERELSEEEAREKAYAGILARYRKADGSWDDWDSGCTWAIEFVLDTLGIVIPGINDAKGGAA